MTGARDVLYEGVTTGSVARHAVEEYGFSADTTVTLEYAFRVRSGPNADVVVLGPDDLDAWTRGRAASYYAHLSALDARDATRSGSLSAGRHFVAVDNTSMGRARPPLTGSDADARIDFELEYAIYR